MSQSLVPVDWMPRVPMSRIIVHWTAGTNKASALDREHYHILIEDSGALVRGKPSIALNDARGVKANYAVHTLNCNTGSIGVALCGMAGAVERPFNAGKYPLTQKQWENLARVCADLCVAYGISVTGKTLLSHAEVQANLGITQRGKWDIATLPFALDLNTAKKCGDDLRSRVHTLLVGQG